MGWFLCVPLHHAMSTWVRGQHGKDYWFVLPRIVPLFDPANPSPHFTLIDLSINAYKMEGHIMMPASLFTCSIKTPNTPVVCVDYVNPWGTFEYTGVKSVVAVYSRVPFEWIHKWQPISRNSAHHLPKCQIASLILDTCDGKWSGRLTASKGI